MGTLFVYYTILFMVPYLQSLGSGSTFSEVSKEVVSNVKIVIPPTNLMNEFNQKIDRYCKMINSLEKENKELASLRDFLLPLLMNGQVTFKE